VTEEQQAAANENRKKRHQIEAELEIWLNQLTRPKRLAYLQGWNSEHAAPLNSSVSEPVFVGFRAAVIADLKKQIEELDAEFAKI